MAIGINTNISALKASQQLSKTQQLKNTSIERLASGLRINSAKDDAAGLSIASRLEKQIRGMNVAIRNVNDGISLAQTAEGFASTISDNLQRMRELGVQAKNGSLSSDDRTLLDKEFQQLVSEIKRTVDSSDFNGNKLFDGTNTSFSIQIGPNTTANDSVSIDTVDLSTLGAYATTLDLTSSANATTAINAIDTDLEDVNTARSTFGAYQSRFDSIVNNLSNSVANLTSSRSRIMDADFAQETINFTKAQILSETGFAMLAQANVDSQSILKLLK